jgi:O-antigen/teichoic acid export membrane protein
MDPATKESFRWKFYRLQIMINIVIFLVAAAFIVLFLAAEEYRIPAFIGLILAAIILALYTRNRYRVTKAWLEEQT